MTALNFRKGNTRVDVLSAELISSDESRKFHQELVETFDGWRDGILSAGPQASAVKKNQQLDPSSDVSCRICSSIKEKLLTNPLVQAFSIPRRIHSMMLSKYEPGDGYGWHVDNPFTSYGRRDLSFTVFLSDPGAYKGGELEIQGIQSSERYRPNMGGVVVYPSSSIHRVGRVEEGARYACVGWIESYVMSSDDRQILFSLNAGAKALLAKHGRSDELDLVFQAYTNALRRLSS